MSSTVPSADVAGSREALSSDLPRHVAIIMDGNRRWAEQKGLPVAEGHRAGAEAARTILRAVAEQDIQVLTLFAFSSENWGRPQAEVNALLSLFSRYLRREIDELQREGASLSFIGEYADFGKKLQKQMRLAEEATAAGGRQLVVAVGYGGRWDIVQAAKHIARQVAAKEVQLDEIDEDFFQRQLCTGTLPEPDLCIRTGGEQRISNFLLWQCAYAELYFTDVLWPDFGPGDFTRALQDYAGRQRRFGRRVPQQSDA